MIVWESNFQASIRETSIQWLCLLVDYENKREWIVTKNSLYSGITGKLGLQKQADIKTITQAYGLLTHV